MYHGDTWRLKFICLGLALPFQLDFLRQGLSFLQPGCILDSELLVCSPASHTGNTDARQHIWLFTWDLEIKSRLPGLSRCCFHPPSCLWLQDGLSYVSVLYQAHGRTWFNVFLVTQEPREWTV